MCHTQALHPLAASAKRAARLSLLLCSHPGLQELLQVRSFSRWQRGSQAERCCSYPVLSEQGHMWRGQEAQLHHKAGCALGTPPSSSSGVLQWATMILGGLLNSGRRSVVVQILNQQAFRFINYTFFFFPQMTPIYKFLPLTHLISYILQFSSPEELDSSLWR